jgi:hypothetical protein
MPKPLIELGEKVAVIPLGSPAALSEIAPVNPSATSVLIVVVPLVPGCTVKVAVFKSNKANPGTGAGAEDLNSQRSLLRATLEVSPPNSQKLPLLSVQAEGEVRPPGLLPAAGTPGVP